MDVYLPIGSSKTGTTSLQEFLWTNRERLADLGYLYPSSLGVKRHIRLSLSVATAKYRQNSPFWNRRVRGTMSVAEFRDRCRHQWLEEIERAGLERMIVSDEALCNMPPQALERLRALLEQVADRVHVIVYLRRQDDHLVSRYQQVVKTGETRTLAEWAAAELPPHYDYAHRLALWQEVVAPDSLVVRPFERCSFVAGSLAEDFLAAVGIPPRRAVDLQPVARRNETLDAEAVELLRLLNLHRVRAGASTAGAIRNSRYIVLLARKTPGPILTLPGPVLDAFMEQWVESNAMVARDHLGRQDGQLFREPRRTDGTTTVQELDPRACHRLMAEVQLPPRARRQVRAVMRELGRPIPGPAHLASRRSIFS